MTAPDPDREPLAGGTANHGRVVRVGDTVHRPRGPQTPAVHRLLRHLTRSGFAGSPRVIGLRTYTEVLEYIPGEAAVDPLPQWSLTDDALASVGALLAEFHRHVAGFDPAAFAADTHSADVPGGRRPIPARWRGQLITHNDPHPANIVFRDGRAVGLIDFDLAAPGCAAWDLAVTACSWAPVRDPVDVTDGRRGDWMRRIGVLLDGYGADQALRIRVAAACADANRWIAGVIRDASERGHPAFGRKWAAQAAMYDRADAWVKQHGDRIAAAVR